MAVTLGDLVQQVRGQLTQFASTREQLCTFVDWVLDGSSNKIGVKLKDVPGGSPLTNADVELGGVELVRVGSYDTGTMTATCPAWFRQIAGTPLSTPTANSMATINPRWPGYRLAEKICHGIETLYPKLFSVKTYALTSRSTDGNYVVPNDVESIIDFNIQGVGVQAFQYKVDRYSLDPANTDGLRYLRTLPSVLDGRPMEIVYKARPTVPDPSNLAATWTSTGLPDSAKDLPVLYAVMCLLPSTDAAKTQMSSMEQSDRNRLVQSGSANAASRRYQELFESRLLTEQRKLDALYPPRIHKTMNR